MAEMVKSLKQLVRDYMEHRAESDDAPPSREEIRRQMGWDLLTPTRRPDVARRDDEA